MNLREMYQKLLETAARQRAWMRDQGIPLSPEASQNEEDEGVPKVSGSYNGENPQEPNLARDVPMWRFGGVFESIWVD